MTLAAALQAKRRHLAYRGAGKLDQYEQIAVAVQELKRRRDREVPLEATPERLARSPAGVSRASATTPAKIKSPVQAHEDQFAPHLILSAAWYTNLVWEAMRLRSPRIGRYNDSPRALGHNGGPPLVGSTLVSVRKAMVDEPAMLECADWMADAAIIEATGRHLTEIEFAARWLKLKDKATRKGFTLGVMHSTMERLSGLWRRFG